MLMKYGIERGKELTYWACPVSGTISIFYDGY